MRNAVIALVLGLGLAGCMTDENEARETLDKAGFTQIKTGDTAFWGCGKDDKMGLEFSALNPNGRRVEGVVCCGVWKSCTVRF